MTLFALFGLIPAMFAAAFADPPAEQQVVRRVVIHDEVIFRIPVRPRQSPVEWIERKGPKCIPANLLAGAVLSGPSSIDFVLRNRQRVRAKMDSDCPALDFYGQFYLQPDDDYICAKREMIHSRVGGSCTIVKFRTLVPQYKQANR